MPPAPIQTVQDVLSPLCTTILRENSNAYELLVVSTRPKAPAELASASPEQLFSRRIVDQEHARAALAALWLWHDDLDRSHTISQNLPSATGSFWHAIMHRREGDFSNSKYWYARCQNHSAIAEIDAAVREKTGQGWEAGRFVDLVEAAERATDEKARELAVKIQRIEWNVLFTHSVRKAVGTLAEK